MKKLLLSLGTVAMAVAPTVTTVACGKKPVIKQDQNRPLSPAALDFSNSYNNAKSKIGDKSIDEINALTPAEQIAFFIKLSDTDKNKFVAKVNVANKTAFINALTNQADKDIFINALTISEKITYIKTLAPADQTAFFNALPNADRLEFIKSLALPSEKTAFIDGLSIVADKIALVASLPTADFKTYVDALPTPAERIPFVQALSLANFTTYVNALPTAAERIPFVQTLSLADFKAYVNGLSTEAEKIPFIQALAPADFKTYVQALSVTQFNSFIKETFYNAQPDAIGTKAKFEVSANKRTITYADVNGDSAQLDSDTSKNTFLASLGIYTQTPVGQGATLAESQAGGTVKAWWKDVVDAFKAYLG